MDLNLENTKGFPLGEEFQEKLLTGARECVMSWSTSEGWPMAICHIFLWHKGRIWTTTSGHKKRVKALRKRPMSCIVISGEGNEVGGERSVSIKTRVTFREDQATRDWFYPAIAAKENPDDPDRAKAFVGLLDSPNRVILEHKPVKFISYDGIAMRDALVAEFTRRLDVGAGESV